MGGQRHVFEQRKLAEGPRNLKGARDPLVADRVRRQAADFHAFETDRARRRPQISRNEIEGRAFARAVRTDKAENLALAHFEGHLIDCQESPEAL